MSALLCRRMKGPQRGRNNRGGLKSRGYAREKKIGIAIEVFDIFMPRQLVC